MSNVTYLMGAGASANAIPIVKDLLHRFEEIIDFLNRRTRNKINEELFNQQPIQLRNNINLLYNIITDIQWLKDEGSNYMTLDSLARTFYTNSQYAELYKLKRTLIIYFTIEQLIDIPSVPNNYNSYTFRKGKEFRYDTLLLNLIDKNKIKSNVKILTWNYDQQLELSLKKILKKEINFLKESYQIIPTIKFPPSNEFDLNAFGIIKLNGNAIWIDPTITNKSFSQTVFDKFEGDYLNQTSEMIKNNMLSFILSEYSTITSINNGKHLEKSLLFFNFSWESDPDFNDKHTGYYDTIDTAVKVAEQTDILVIIGYSFPDFNNITDKRLINSMSAIKKIYIQDPNCTDIKETLVDKFELIRDRINHKDNLDIIEKPNFNNFYIPSDVN